MDHLAKDICPSAMGYHNQGHDSYDRSVKLLHGHQPHRMDWEPFMLPYRAGVSFFVGATLNMYPGPKGGRQNYEVSAR